ncbi:L-rhamnose mutarotase [Mucilaginibacter aquaedulcis]|uniref:L-rhamnose mutarotase n=1 Tax=Mucilaginibacter aquaedulcis TaxID=1187081 RepID=UPI0025B4F51C|nr:L-rhamnose mutarotase [Mucilaginibacter aquaedulcis]MDN3548420.1 L-rhamnose mutarotase [Mucilaginibacter aquaedulcis]
MRYLIKYIRKGLVLMIVLLVLLGKVKAYALTSPFSVVEVILAKGKIINSAAITRIAKSEGLPASSVYQWNNHLVVYSKNLNVTTLQKAVKLAYPTCTVKVYTKPFYDFDRKQQCGNMLLADEWDNIILTANLVNDSKLQQEYLNYHATQFKKWPEVAKGFCNANFQQLLVFRNGRQLMLVISIPKGESLDKLNPKTSENNPRVNEWNKLMKKYQEGIPGSKPGEVWAFFKNKNQ